MKRALFILAIVVGMSGVQCGKPATPVLTKLTATSVLGPYSTAINYVVAFAGKPDTRPTTWGLSDAFASQILFHPPAGYRTMILRVYGDLIAFPQGSGMSAPSVTKGSVEIGWGCKNSSPDGDTRVTYPGYPTAPFANSFVWIQGIITPQQPSIRMPFDFDTSAGGLLNADNLMLSQPFIALNTTGLVLQIEPTFVVVFSWVKQ